MFGFSPYSTSPYSAIGLSGSVEVSVDGVGLSLTLASVGVEGGFVDVAVSGVGLSVQLGAPAFSLGSKVVLDGVELSIGLTTPIVSIPVAFELSGVGTSLVLGDSFVVTAGSAVAVSGVELVAYTGLLDMIGTANVLLEGVELIVRVSQPLVWNPIENDIITDWTPIPPEVTDIWVEIPT